MTVLNHSPTYSGKPKQLSESCQHAPLPDVKPYDGISAINNITSSIIQWPPNEDTYHPLDQYLGNCISKGYCSPFDNLCHPKLEDGHPCNSTNQCLESQCVDGYCNAGPKLWSSTEVAQQSSNGFNAIHLVAGVVGITALIIIAAISFLVFRKRRRTEQLKKESTLPTTAPYPSSPGTGLGTFYNNPRPISFATFANDFNQPTSDSALQSESSRDCPSVHTRLANNDSSGTAAVSPAMQQLQLQLMLQQELRSQEMQEVQPPVASRQENRLKERPPPPYQP
ncbi:hypothetical protein K450DRAFT_249276 [Umbelopsis ramanniana AG]|uniref:Uncharacterized protein n=1 Tax=Umbelopsis ramanniana AG TaxID=1314678 RepID=A0AAD5E5W5_UMBRA|nr:uncharacterized protein K450DRAFT_249276 [Umbelopsis ramanniana AG]KAI8577971.1 hypothetical protein K450DRAFT_249276 [Umbelopsis ramanniana AG]